MSADGRTGGGRRPAGEDRRRRRDDAGREELPRRLGDVIGPALERLAGGDEAKAYAAWTRAVGEPVSGGTRPKAFRRGQLTVECASSVWANELTYLGPQILRRMDEVAPGHPVERFRFIVGRLQARAAPDEPDQAGEPKRLARQGSGSPTAKEKRRHATTAPDAPEPARPTTEGVRDGRLRAAIEAALRPSSEGSSETPGSGTPQG